MKRVLHLTALLSLMACGSENGWQGTGVGNPGSQLTGDETRVSIATEDGLTLHSATIGVAQWMLEDCDGEMAFLEVGRQVDLLDSEVFPLPQGEWCEAVLEFDRNLKIEGEFQAPIWPNPGAISVDLHVTELTIQGPFDFEGDALTLELAHPGWLELSKLGVLTGGNLSVDPGSLGHGLLSDRVSNGSGWFFDPNGNGRVDGGERVNGPKATGQSWSDGSDDDLF